MVLRDLAVEQAQELLGLWARAVHVSPPPPTARRSLFIAWKSSW
jgi:hypothetical protein